MSGWRLARTVQCAKCPWKASTDPYDIPNGYDVKKHRALRKSIADPGSCRMNGDVMACHESNPGEEAHCIGWLVHQLGPGNNIGLRLRMLTCENADQIRVVGEQHERFEDTLPRKRRKART